MTDGDGTVLESCLPYSVGRITYPYPSVSCPSTCENGKPFDFYKLKTFRRVTGTENIKKELM